MLSVHIGSSGRLTIPAVDSPSDVMITLQSMNIVSAAADLLWSRVIKHDLEHVQKVADEAGIGNSRYNLPTDVMAYPQPAGCSPTW